MHKKLFGKTSAAIIAAAMIFNIAAPLTNAAEDNIYEFENAEIEIKKHDEEGWDTIVDTSESGFSGDGYVFMKGAGDTVSMEVEVPETGMYELTVCYSLDTESGAKTQYLYVNDSPSVQISFSPNDGFAETSIGTFKLNKGKNTIKIESFWGWMRFDYMKVQSASLSEIKAVQNTCTDIQATAATRALMAYLSDMYGKHIISGQQEIYSGGPHGLETEFEYLKDTTGHYPAIRGFDYGNFCCPAYGSDDGSTKRIIDWVKNRNGIATASFHINVPNKMDSYKIGDRIDWSQTSYNAKDNDFKPSNAYTEGTKEYEYYHQALETLAAEFNKLEEEGVPVIWRPLHEAEGGGGETGSWFWWGKEGSEVYKKLWIYTYETLTNEFGCHNLIWEWNSYDFDTSANWYPGDEYVDIIGYDKYSCTVYLAEDNWAGRLVHNDSPASSTFYNIMNRYDSAKMVAMAENDSFSTIENITDEKAGWLYFCTWYDGGSDNINFLSNPTFNTKEDTIAMYQSEYCITLDELPDNLYSRKTDAPDPSKTTTKVTTTKNTATTTSVTTTSNTAVTGTTTAGYTFEVQKYPVKFPSGSKSGNELTFVIEGAAGASIGGALGYSAGPKTEDWVNVEWSGNADSDGKLTVSIPLDKLPDDTVSGEIQIWWSNVWNASTAKAVDEPAEVASYDVISADLCGDANCDGIVNLADTVLIMQSLVNPDAYGLKGTEKSHITEEGWKNADCCDRGNGVTNNDAVAIQKYCLELITSLPETLTK